MRNPLNPGYDPERFDRELRLPEPPAPRLAMGNEDWKAEHGDRLERGKNTKSPNAAKNAKDEAGAEPAYAR